MFFSLKKKLMAKAIAKRNLEHPFDFAYAEEAELRNKPWREDATSPPSST